MSLFIILLLFLLTLSFISSSPLFILLMFSLFTLFPLVSYYNLGFFSPFSLNTSGFLCDEYSSTLLFMIIFVIFYSCLTHFAGSTESNPKTYSLLWLLALMSLSSLYVFSSTSLLVIYIGYEMSLIPIILIIFLWGTYPERSSAAITILLYTLAFSLPLILFFSYLWSCSVISSSYSLTSLSLSSGASDSLSIIFSLLVFMAFAVNLPIYGLHSWLPIAHVEAPTFGSMILAGLLLNLGGCGLYRFSLFMPGLFYSTSSVLIGFLVLSIVVSGIVCSIQSDLKRLIAYSSVVHITSVGVLFLLDSSMALYSSLILMVLHGVSSPLMFNIVGQVYSSLGTRLVISIRSIKSFYPLLYVSMIIGFYLTVPVPPSLAFLGELYLFTSLLKFTWVISFLSGLYLFISIIFNLLWLTIFFGSSSLPTSFEPLVQKIIPLSISLLGLIALFLTNSMFM